MKKINLFGFLIICSLFSTAQNVGVGTNSPTEKLDVNGNINVAGQIKVNGNAGSSNQVLMKNAANNMVWGNVSDYKNLQLIECTNTATVTGASNCTSSWVVPSSITEIFVECWGGGGGGALLTGGAGGGYASAKFTVVPGNMVSLTIAAGGQFSTSPTSYGIAGGSSSCFNGIVGITAFGGGGGASGDPTTSTNGTPPSGGMFSATGLSNQWIGFHGSPGGISKTSFMTAAAGDYAKIVNYGDGGDAALLPGSGAKGGYRIMSATMNQNIYTTQLAVECGGGGGSDPTNGFNGRGGRVIIHW